MSVDVHELILTSTVNQVTTLTMNMPKRLNGWTFEMMEALREAFECARADESTRVLILTGADPYYCAGVNLGGTLRLAHPRKLHEMIVEHNKSLFELFLDFPKPILVAVNGPAIGASVTSATLCDGIIASNLATFSTPFAKLGVVPEGCSSVLFAQLMGEETAQRMLGAEGWIPTGAEALEVGLVQWLAPHEALLERAQALAETWIKEGATRSFRTEETLESLKLINAQESIGVADSFLSPNFMMAQARFLWSRKKRIPAMMFLALRLSRFMWVRLL